MSGPSEHRNFESLPPTERLIAICDEILSRQRPRRRFFPMHQGSDEIIERQSEVIERQAAIIARAVELLEKHGRDGELKQEDGQKDRQRPSEGKRKPPQKKPEAVAENAVQSRFHLDAIDPRKDSTIKDPSKYRSYPKKEVLERLRKAGEEIITRLFIRENFPENVDHPLREIPFWGDANPLRDYLGTCGFADGTLDEHTPELDVIAANVEVLVRALRSNTLLPEDGGKALRYAPHGFLICYIPSNGKVEVIRQNDAGEREVINTIG